MIYTPSDLESDKAILRYGATDEQYQTSLQRLNALDKLCKSPKCIWQEIERYFGEKPDKKCGYCSRCRYRKLGKARKQTKPTGIRIKIRVHLLLEYIYISEPVNRCVISCFPETSRRCCHEHKYRQNQMESGV